MAKPIAVKDGTCFAFPDILDTPNPSGTPTDIPIPYPNIAQLSDAEDTSEDVKAGGTEVILKTSTIAESSGGDAGTSASTQNDKCSFTEASETVKANGEGIVRQFDSTEQNDGNAQGMVMSGVSTVLVGD